jgi:hypothetical protein
MADIEALARQLYERGTRSAPTWEQLGEVTRGEWRAMAKRHAEGDPRWYSCQPRPSVEQQPEFF